MTRHAHLPTQPAPLAELYLVAWQWPPGMPPSERLPAVATLAAVKRLCCLHAPLEAELYGSDGRLERVVLQAW